MKIATPLTLTLTRLALIITRSSCSIGSASGAGTMANGLGDLEVGLKNEKVRGLIYVDVGVGEPFHKTSCSLFVPFVSHYCYIYQYQLYPL